MSDNAMPPSGATDKSASNSTQITNTSASAGYIPSNLTDLTGQNIAHYFLESRVGGGAMASVYRARDEILDRVIALKVLMPGADSLTRARFRQEARTVSTLEHPHIVRTLQVGQTSADGIAYIAMELVEGQSLSGMLEQCTTLNVIDACNLLEPIARALSYAHGLGIVHRDVKPSNILLRWASTSMPNSIQLSMLDTPVIPLLSDFGIARALDSPELTSAGRTIGTPSYMAPEQCAGSRELDGRADIYSLGTVLYRCLVGRPPFIGTTTQILHAHVYEPLIVPEHVLRNLSPLVIEMLQRTLMKDVDHRYPSAAMLADNLAAAAGRQNALFRTPPDNMAANRPTRTMDMLPAANSPESEVTPSRILIPGSTATPIGLRSVTPPSVPRVGSTTHAKVVHPSGASPKPRRRNRSWLSVLIGTIMLLILVLVGTAVVRSILPSAGITPSPQVSGISTVAPPDVAMQATAQVSAQDVAISSDLLTTTPTLVAGEPTVADSTTEERVMEEPLVEEPVATSTAPNIVSENVLEEVNPSAVESDTTAAPSVTDAGAGISGAGDADAPDRTLEESAESPSGNPPATVTPDFSLESAWDDAQFFFDQREWAEAITYLTLIHRRDPDYNDQVADMLITSYVGLATIEITNVFSETVPVVSQLADAVDFLDKALAVEEKPEVAAIRTALQSYMDGSGTQQAEARRDLRTAHASHAESLAESTDYCGATEQLTAALNVLYDAATADQQVAYLDQCPELAEADVVVAQPAMQGNLLYSSTRNDTNVIWTVPVTESAPSQLLIEGGALPSLQPRGTMIAFVGTGSFDSEGIFGFDMAQELGPSGRSVQYTYNVEDSRQSPPSWNPDSTQLIYSSIVAGDRIPRIYTHTIAEGGGLYRLSAFGSEPAWHPSQDLVVHKGADASGNQPGLWLMNGAGDNRVPLTDNGADGRPVWSPDGRSIVFMSNGRDNNWEIYRVDVQTQVVARLTTNAAFDGLPAVSPDGKFVAFVSDRGGEWRFWSIPISGGDAQAITDVAGTISNWTNHSIQWIE